MAMRRRVPLVGTGLGRPALVPSSRSVLILALPRSSSADSCLSVRRDYATHTFSPAPLPNDEKPVAPIVERDVKAIFNVFDVPLFYTYQTTPRWRESPAMAHRRAERKRMTEVRKRARSYVDTEVAKERERLRLEREQMERWKAIRLEKRREEWRAKMVEREKVESLERAEREQLEAQNVQAFLEKNQLKVAAKREWLQCVKEELHKFDLADLPHLMSLKNYKYETYNGKQWYTKNH